MLECGNRYQIEDDCINEPVMMCDAHGVCAGEDCPRFDECKRKE